MLIKTRSFTSFYIASLSLHFDEFERLLQNSDIKFDFIGITETGLKSNVELHLEGYNKEDCLTEFSKGGVRLSISDSHNYFPRNDLKLYKKGEIESVFLEITNSQRQNLVLGCIYKHPKINIDEFNILYTN